MRKRVGYYVVSKNYSFIENREPIDESLSDVALLEKGIIVSRHEGVAASKVTAEVARKGECVVKIKKSIANLIAKRAVKVFVIATKNTVWYDRERESNEVATCGTIVIQDVSLEYYAKKLPKKYINNRRLDLNVTKKEEPKKITNNQLNLL